MDDATWACERDDAYRRARGLGVALLLASTCATALFAALTWWVQATLHAA